jgi:hypothetical protein
LPDFTANVIDAFNREEAKPLGATSVQSAASKAKRFNMDGQDKKKPKSA